MFIYSPVTASNIHVLTYLIKNILYRLQLAGWLYRLQFRYAVWKNREKNTQYRNQYPDTVLPPDIDLFQTFELNYRKFITDGELAAKELMEWTSPYLSADHPVILDWGCGTGRIIRHIPSLQPHAQLYACDINESLINWDRENLPGITFSTINSFSPTLYADGFFDLVYGFSVLTHIDAALQQDWLAELHRILKPGGIAFITTHGNAYTYQLLPGQRKKLRKNGIYTQSFPVAGHRMASTYHQAASFKKKLEPFFTIKECYDGNQHPEKAGGQDVWMVQKREA